MLLFVFMFHSVSPGVLTDTISLAFLGSEHPFYLKDSFEYLTKLIHLQKKKKK